MLKVVNVIDEIVTIVRDRETMGRQGWLTGADLDRFEALDKELDLFRALNEMPLRFENQELPQAEMPQYEGCGIPHLTDNRRGHREEGLYPTQKWYRAMEILRALITARLDDGKAVFSQQPAATPTDEPLTSWREVLDAIGLKYTDTNRDKVRKLNQQEDGPIVLPSKGGEPKVINGKRLEWWAGLGKRFEDNQQRRTDAEATLQEQYRHGREGQVVPGIAGHVKKRRSPK